GTKEVHIVKGNHDGGIEHIVPKGVKVHGSEGFVWEGLGLFHGHTWPSENVMRAKVVLMAHIHPKVKLYEGRFSFVTEPCWLRGKWRGLAKGLAKSMGNELGNGLVKGLGKKRYENVDLDADVIVMPAYNEYLGGSAVNDTCNKLIGPVLANGLFDLENASVYLLDGTYLGEVGSLIMKNDK
ncbi:MAG: hypothetical protein QXT63_01130, partial [Thermoplasmata archaeon]